MEFFVCDTVFICQNLPEQRAYLPALSHGLLLPAASWSTKCCRQNLYPKNIAALTSGKIAGKLLSIV